MARVKISRKKLVQEPDEFLSLSQRVWLWVHDNQGRAAAIAGGAVGAVLLVVLVSSLVQSSRNARVEEVARVMDRYLAPKDGAPVPDVSRDFADLAQKYAGDTEGVLARYFLGAYHGAKGDYARAGEAFAEVGKNAPAGTGLGTLARVAEGYVALARGESDRALEDFQKLVQDKGAVVPRAQLQMEIGALLEQKGRLADARRVYEEVSQANPDSTWHTKAKERLRAVTERMKAAS
jgi:hypothetical protein